MGANGHSNETCPKAEYVFLIWVALHNKSFYILCFKMYIIIHEV